MPHSLSSLYSLYWANTYPQEVRGFIGIDPSVTKQSDEDLPIRMITLMGLDGRHYLHFERKQELIEKVREWVRKVEESL